MPDFLSLPSCSLSSCLSARACSDSRSFLRSSAVAALSVAVSFASAVASAAPASAAAFAASASASLIILPSSLLSASSRVRCAEYANVPSAPAGFTIVEQNTPVSTAPTNPPTPWTPKASSESS